MTRNSCHHRRPTRRATAPAVCALLAWSVAAAATSGQSLPVANFAELMSTATERSGRIELRVTLSREFSGSLVYRVDGTAERGMDFDYPVAVPEVDGPIHKVDTGGPVRDLDIVIDLRDDTSVEDAETIRLTLLPGDGLLLGSNHQHTVSIWDNDANWRVAHDANGLKFDYGMQIIRMDGSASATVTSDGGDGLPAGTYPVDLTADEDRFEAIVGPITVAADQTLLGAEVARTLTLIADRSEPGHTIDYNRLLIGSATETWSAANSALHLTRGKPISSTFLLSRTDVDPTPPPTTRKEKKSPRTKPVSVVANEDNASGCRVADVSEDSNFAVRPASFMLSAPPDSLTEAVDEHPKPYSPYVATLESSAIGQPFAPNIPYPDFVSATLNQARALLYYDEAPTQEAKDAAAFRYKTLLYEREKVGTETYIRARFDKLEDHWNCAERERAYHAADIVIDALRYAPWNRELRWALLDIYYDIAVAEKAVAQEKHVAVARIMIEPVPGNRLIDQEIAALKQALPLYRSALVGYMGVLQRAFGVDSADVATEQDSMGEPFGYYLFRKEVSLRSPLAALFKNADDNWVLPLDAGRRYEQPRPVFDGYKDVTLLFELLREYLRTAEQLSKRFVMRGAPADLVQAERLIGTALLATYMEGNLLIAMFPEVLEQGGQIDPTSGLREAIAGWRHAYSALGHIRGLLGSNTNLLGIPDGFVALTQSVIPGDSESRYFNSYDSLAHLLKEPGSPLGRAKNHLREAEEQYDDYRDRNDQFVQQLRDRTEHYDERLREIVGVVPGMNGYDNPQRNEGGLIHQQHTAHQSRTSARKLEPREDCESRKRD